MLKIKHIGLGLAFALVGCAAAPQTGSQLSDRLSNAQQITDSHQKDDALQTIAKDAANSAQPQLCLNAVGGIADSRLRDMTAHGCADTFNGKGDRSTATALVGMIGDAGLKDQILKAYADRPAPQPK